MPFDARAAKILAPGLHLNIEECPGLKLVASVTRRAWIYRYKSPVDARMRQVKLGEWPAMGLPAAVVAWESSRQQRAEGVDLAAAKREARAAVAPAADNPLTVRRLVDDFIAAYLGTVAEKTYAEVEWMFRTLLGPIEHQLAATVTRADAYDLIDGLRSTPVLAKRLRQALGAAWERAHDSGRLPAETPNWWRIVLRGKLPSRGKPVAGKRAGVGKRVLDPDELGALIRWLPNFLETTRDALALYAWTLCRGAEIVGMERGEVTTEADGMWWTIPRERLKMRRNPLTTDLRVPLIGRARAVVERRLAEVDGRWLFPSPKTGGHVQQDAIGAAVYHRMPYSEARALQTRARLEVTHWAPHDLRRTGRTMLASMDARSKSPRQSWGTSCKACRAPTTGTTTTPTGGCGLRGWQIGSNL